MSQKQNGFTRLEISVKCVAEGSVIKPKKNTFSVQFLNIKLLAESQRSIYREESQSGNAASYYVGGKNDRKIKNTCSLCIKL